MLNIIDSLKREWTTFKAAPWAAVPLMALSATVGFLVAQWHYEGMLQSLREQLNLAGERLVAKDEQLLDYRERLHIIPVGPTSLSKLTNSELQDRALDVVSKLKEFIAERKAAEDQLMPFFLPALPAEETKRYMDNQWTRLVQLGQESQVTFFKRFQTDVLLLRDELLARLPSTAKSNGFPFDSPFDSYEHPVNLQSMAEVATDLDRLARLLPRRAGA